MRLLDSILNLVCLLMWINWRSLQIASPDKSPVLSLASALKKTEPRRGARWLSLVGIVVVLILRALFYWNVGSALNWTPNLQLGVVSLPFRSDYAGRMLLFSFLSFALVLGGFYACLLFISVINARVSSDQPFHKLVRLHLSWVARWPTLLRFLLPMIAAILLWGLGSRVLIGLGILPAPVRPGHVWQQAALLGLTSILAWKFLIVAICLLYAINSYVYFGKSQFWDYVNITGNNLLWPLRRLPVCIGKLDLAPLLAIGVVLGLTHLLGRWLPRIFQQLSL